MFRTVKLALSLLLCLILSQSLALAKFQKRKSSEWAAILSGMAIAPDRETLERLERSGDTIEKIQGQISEDLKLENWIDIFKKLNIQPKKDMQHDEWATFFDKIGIVAKKEDVQTPQSQSSIKESQEAQNARQQPLSSAASYTPTLVPAAMQAQSVSPNTSQPVVAKSSTPITPVEIVPPVKQPQINQATEKVERSAKISLDLRGADIFSALKIISQKTGLSIVASNNIKGSVTLFLQDVDALDALKMILEMNDLAYAREGNVFKVMMAQDYEKIYGKRFYDTTKVDIIKLNSVKVSTIEKTITPIRSKIGQIITDPGSNSFIVIDTPENIDVLKKLLTSIDVKMETKTFSINYAKPKDVFEKVKNDISLGIGDIQFDERTGQIIVVDTPERIKDISKIIDSLDRRNKEVMIEARIIQIILSNEFQMGVNWSSVFNKVGNNTISGSVTGNLNALAVGSSGIRLSVGTLSIDNFTALYDVLQTVGKTNMISSPKIAVIDNQEAKILVGTKQAYVTTTVTTPGNGIATTAEAVNFIDVGVKLYVTPSIGDDGFITMKIRPEISAVQSNLVTATGNTIPIVRTTESETTVMVKDGVTIVIGGLMEDQKVKTVSGIPILCRIPLIGIPFRRTDDSDVKTELAVFLTPHVISGDYADFSNEDKK